MKKPDAEREKGEGMPGPPDQSPSFSAFYSLEPSKTCMFYYRKEEWIPRGGKLRFIFITSRQ